MKNKIEIKICLGSSCFSRGNKEIVNFIQEYIKTNNLSEKVNLKGGHCFGNCNNGPSIKINNEIYNGINQEMLKNILNKNLKL